jgi:hypothetical protein
VDAAAATSAGAPKTAPKEQAKAPAVKVEITKDQVQVGDIVHLNGSRYKANFNNFDAEVIACLANMVKVKFLQGPCKSTENKFTYANIEKIVSRAAAAIRDAAAATGAEAVFRRLPQHLALMRTLRPRRRLRASRLISEI